MIVYHKIKFDRVDGFINVGICYYKHGKTGEYVITDIILKDDFEDDVVFYPEGTSIIDIDWSSYLSIPITNIVEKFL
jgi:hypothetical protein